MDTYAFRFKRHKSWFWKKETVVGHKLFPEQDKMVLYFKDGGLREIVKWSECEIRLGADWVTTVQNNMKKESGADIKLQVGA
jgi:hypothetical protein